MSEPPTAALLKLRQAAAASYQIDQGVADQIDPRDSLFMCGFWRSGTTWLQEALTTLLAAKLVFEPLYSGVHDLKAIYRRDAYLANRKQAFLRLYMPFCGEPTLDGHPLRGFLERALRSELPGRWVRIYRRALDESARTKVIVKCVRAQLCLRAVQNTFGMPVIHIYRDPRAVAASAEMTTWKKQFEPLSLRRQLLEPPDGRADFFGRWRDEIIHYDKQGAAPRLAAYWALTEKFVQHSYADAPSRIIFLSYEELVRRRETVVLEVLRNLGLAPVAQHGSEVLDSDSSTTMATRRGASVDERLAGWKQTLSADEIASIEAIAAHFGFEDRLAS
jgi:hypothetical protein